MNASRELTDTLAQLLVTRAADTPAAIAFRRQVEGDRWESVTWHDFAQMVQKVRRGLAAAGLQRGDRLALIAPVSLEWEILNHAALSLGVAVVGMDAHDLPARIADMADQAGISAFVVDDAAVLQKVAEEALEAARFVLHLRPGTGTLPAGVRQLNWVQFGALGAQTTREVEPESPSPEDVATIIFTSGTTGAPRGIPYSHAQVCLAVNAACDAFAFVDIDSRLLCWLPLSNLFQRVVNLAAVRQGAVTYLLGDPRQVMNVVGEVSPDVFIGVPRFFEKLYDGLCANIAARAPLMRWLVTACWAIGRRVSRFRLRHQAPPLGLRLAHFAAERLVLRRIRGIMGRRLRVMVTGSAPTPRHLLEEFHALGWLVLEAYGLSENVVPMAMNRPDAFRLGTVGRAVAQNEIVVGDDGAIKVRGPGVFRGYLRECGANPIDPEGYYSTGDFGRIDADGYMQLLGRSGDLIKTSTGRRVAPAGVEASLRLVSGIDQVVLIGAGRKCLVALCTLAHPDMGAEARLRLVCALGEQAAAISEHERPRGVALLDRPFSIDQGDLTPNLKIRRVAVENRNTELIEQTYAAIDRSRAAGKDNLVVIWDRHSAHEPSRDEVIGNSI